MKSFKDFLIENKSFSDIIDSALRHTNSRDRKVYIDKLNSLTKSQISDVENAMQSEADKYIDSEYKKTGTWDEKKELKIMVNTMDAMIDSILN